MNRILIIIIYFVYYSAVYSQLSQPELIFKGEGVIGGDVKIFDFNNDGIEDILTRRVLQFGEVSNRFKLVLYIGNRKNQKLEFDSVTLYNKPVYKFFLYDLDLDNDKDILVKANQNEDCYKIIINHGNLNFAIDSSINFELSNQKCIDIVDIRDFNSDGNDDILFQNSELGSENLMLGIINSLNKFTVQDFGISSFYSDINIGTINEDNLPDLFVHTSSSRLIMVKSMNPDSIVEIYNANKFDLIDNIDITGDGLDDLIIENNTNDTIYAITNLLDNNPIILIPIINSPDLGTLNSFDIDLDNDIDLIDNFNRTVWINNSNGVFTSKKDSIFTIPYRDIIYKKEIITENKAIYFTKNSPIDIYENNNGIWTNYHIALKDYNLNSLDDVEMYDIDHDGFEDLVYCSRWANTLAYLKGNRNKKFGPNISIFNDELGVNNVEFGDFNNDKIIDIATASIWDMKVSIKYGLSNGTYTERNYLPFNFSFIYNFESIDLNKDGYEDFVIQDFSTEQVSYFKNRITGFEKKPVTLPKSFLPGKIFLYDLHFDDNNISELIISGIDTSNNTITYDVTYILKYIPEEDTFIVYDQLGFKLRRESFHDFDKDGKEELIRAGGHIWKYDNETQKYDEWIYSNNFGFRENDGFIIIDANGDKYSDIIYHRSYPKEKGLGLNFKNEYLYFKDLVKNQTGYEWFDMTDKDYFNLDIDNDNDLDFISLSENNIYIVRDLEGDKAIRGRVYIDENNDEVYNANDIPLGNISIDVFSENNLKYTTQSNDNGEYTIFTDTGHYEVKVKLDSTCWNPTSNNVKYVFVKDETLYDVDFRLKDGENQNDLNITANISRGLTRCNREVRYHVSLKNEECTPLAYDCKIYIDNRIKEIHSLNDVGNSFIDNKLEISIDTISASNTKHINFIVKLPGEEYVNTILIDSILVNTYDLKNANEPTLKVFNFHSPVLCAVDPNDKLAEPNRSLFYDKPYITNEEINYTIRFQNTGNDTAFTVKLIDTLSNLLDLNTFNVINSSHPFEFTLNNEKRELIVIYENILLPDSSKNQLESNGFFTFSIKPNQNIITENEGIFNKAYIFFDLNAPIVTNNCELVFVNKIPSFSSTNNSKENDFSVIPNPNSGDFLLFSKLKNLSQYQISIFNSAGDKVPFIQEGNKIALNTNTPGIYIIQFESETQKSFTKFVLTF